MNKKMFRVTYTTKDSAPAHVPYYEPNFVRAVDLKGARAEANVQIESRYKKYIKVDKIRSCPKTLEVV